ncbi:MAG TPA: zf-HC2 domain-containing protein [Bryobacteraceae bacterium]|nr:zf-HC2 domain-containing protein [Bryobacteraceae bacterium]
MRETVMPMPWDTHLPDAQLLLALDGELSTRETKKVQRHLAACWKCRARQQELERTITDFARFHQENEIALPSRDGPRALLRARLAQLSRAEVRPRHAWIWAAALAGCVVLFVAIMNVRHPEPYRPAAVAAIPDSRITPGATLMTTRESVCAQPNTNNRAVPVALRRKVFAAYGIAGASPRDYEVDYLITPALGGADDIHNLWPQPYSATVWNAEVKDALEDRLRDMVCDGSLDLTEAQREIAVNWIAAYKKYFHTDRPLTEHYRQ